MVKRLGRIEVTARLLARPGRVSQISAPTATPTCSNTKCSRSTARTRKASICCKPGDRIFVGHYKPWMPRDQIKDADWGDAPLGGKLARFVAGQAHRMALDYELQQLAPSGALDYCFPPGVNRFFAVWTNPADL